MVLVDRLQKNVLTYASIFWYVSGISCATHFNGDLQVLLSGKTSHVSLASAGSFCVARQNADPTALKAGIDWACGPGSANCGPIQPGQPCYVANNLVAIASYAYDAYYQANQATGGTCSFNNTATLTNSDPSSGSCIFPGSTGIGTGSGGGSGAPPNGGSGAPPNGGSGAPPSSSSGTPPNGGFGAPPIGGSGTPPIGGSGAPFGPSFAPPGAFVPTDDGNSVPRQQAFTLAYLWQPLILSLFTL